MGFAFAGTLIGDTLLHVTCHFFIYALVIHNKSSCIDILKNPKKMSTYFFSNTI